MATGGGDEALIVERMLPGLDGSAVIGALRAAKIAAPVLIRSALGQVDDRVRGLRAGADDYLTKPFAFSELLARIEALLRRQQPGQAAETRLVVGHLEMDLLSRLVTRPGRQIALLPRDFPLLAYPMPHAGHAGTRTPPPDPGR